MSKHNRRGLILGGTTLLTGGALVSLRSMRSEEETKTESTQSDAPSDDAEDGDGGDNEDDEGGPPDTDDGSDETAQTTEADESTDDAEPTDSSLELSVSATDSVSVSGEHVDFLVTVTNTGDEPTTVPVSLEIEHVYERPEALEIDPGERDDAYVSLESRSFGPGAHDWTVTAGNEVETGTATVEAEDDSDEPQDDLGLSVDMIDGATVRLQDDETSTRLGCEFSVFNNGSEPVSTTGTLEVGDETTSIPVDLDPGESEHYREPVVVEAGDQEWTVAVGDDAESGVFHVGS